MVDRFDTEGEAHDWVSPSRWVHLFTLLAMSLCLSAVAIAWPSLVKDPIQTFGTVGLFLTAYGVLFSIIEVLRTQSATLAAGKAAERAAHIARSPYDMRDVSECVTTIENVVFAIQRRGSPKSQPLLRIIKLYSTIFEDKYHDDKSAERIRIGIVQSYVPVATLKTGDAKLATTLAEMASDLAARGASITMKVGKP